jgi:hypothetical protein
VFSPLAVYLFPIFTTLMSLLLTLLHTIKNQCERVPLLCTDFLFFWQCVYTKCAYIGPDVKDLFCFSIIEWTLSPSLQTCSFNKKFVGDCFDRVFGRSIKIHRNNLFFCYPQQLSKSHEFYLAVHAHCFPSKKKAQYAVPDDLYVTQLITKVNP